MTASKLKISVLGFLLSASHLAMAEYTTYLPCESEPYCAVEHQAKKQEQAQMKDRQDQEIFRNQQLQLEQEQVDEVRTQNSLMEEQLENPQETLDEKK